MRSGGATQQQSLVLSRSVAGKLQISVKKTTFRMEHQLKHYILDIAVALLHV